MGDDGPRPPPESPPAGDDPFGGLNPGACVSKYEIVATLGQGAFGITYRARDTQLGRDVALKEYLPASFAVRRGDSTVQPRSARTTNDFIWGRERFLDEARTLAHLEGAPGIVNVHDFLEANGTAYMVMALARGETLEARLRRDRRLPQTALEQMLYPLLDGLEKVHDAQFLHRDIKPANILVDREGRPTLIDFGASRIALSDRTQSMTAVYTPGYAAFEQMISGRQGPWTDIYALAGTLYHCIAGAPPPPALDRLSEDTLRPAAEIGKDRYAPSLLSAIDAGLALKAPDRPQSVADWRRLFYGMGTVATGAPPEAAATRLMVPTAEPPPRRRASLPLAVAGVVALGLAAAGAYVFIDRQQEQAQQALKRAEEEKAAAARRQAEAAERQRAADVAARRKADADAKARADAESRRRRDEQIRRETEDRLRAEYEARAKAESEAREKVEAEARRHAEDARREAEEKARADAEAKRQAAAAEARRQAEAAEAALRLSPDDRRQVHVGLTALGFDTHGIGSTFGPRTREMIAAWQKSRAVAETGYLTATDLAALRRQAAPALARHEEEQKKAEDAKRKAAEEKAKADAARSAPTTPPRPPDAAPRPATTAANRFDGAWRGTFGCDATNTKQAFSYGLTASIKGGVLTWQTGRAGEPGSQTATGHVAADNTVVINVEGINSGRAGAGERGTTFRSQYRGRIDGRELAAESVTSLPRRCVLSMKRS